ncbi:MAG: hypothetical protein GY950_30530, partial [bacterium]|nr:hypothetical protein [bacterium]
MQNTQNTRGRLVLSMMAVIIPGLVISILGIVYVSQQRNARELKLREKYETMLAQIRDETERQMEAAIEKTIKQIAVPGTAAAVKEPGTLQNLLKAVLLQNPVVKYPFLIDAEGTYIFPFSRRTGLLREGPVTADDTFLGRFGKGTGKGSVFYKKYREAEDLEFRERRFYEAVKGYLESLEEARTVGKGNVRFYVFFAIARCYYKLNKFPQAADYLE